MVAATWLPLQVNRGFNFGGVNSTLGLDVKTFQLIAKRMSADHRIKEGSERGF